nr:cytochrome p450 [Quercus suber]
MDSSMLQTVVLLSTFVLSAFFLLKSQASPKEMEQIPGSMGWPIVGESFSFLSDFSSPSGVYNFMKKRQQRYGKVFKTSVMGRFTVFMTERSKQDLINRKRWDGKLEPLLHRQAGVRPNQFASNHWRNAQTA